MFKLPCDKKRRPLYQKGNTNHVHVFLFALTLSTLGKKSADDVLNYISYFPQKTGFDISW